MKRLLGWIVLCLLLCPVGTWAAETAMDTLPDALDLPEMGLRIELDSAWKKMFYQHQLLFLNDYQIDEQGLWMRRMTLDLYYCGGSFALYEEGNEAWLADNAHQIATVYGAQRSLLTADSLAHAHPGQAIEWLPSSGSAYRYALVRYPLPALEDPVDQACLEAIELSLARPANVFIAVMPKPFKDLSPFEETQRPFTGLQTVDFDGNPVDETVFANSELTLLYVWNMASMPDLAYLQTMGELSRANADWLQVVGIPSDITFSNGALDKAGYDAACLLVARARANHTHWLPDGVLRGVIEVSPYVPIAYFVDREGNILGDGVTGSHALTDWVQQLQAARLQITAQ